MVRTSVMRLYVGVVGLVMVTAGCNCQSSQDECKTLTAVFTHPADGATVNPVSDFEVRANNSVGNGVALSSATIAVKPPGAAAFGAERDASLAFNKALLTGLTLQPGQNQVRVTMNTVEPACAGKTADTATDSGMAPPESHGRISTTSFADLLFGAPSYACPKTAHQNQRLSISRWAPASAFFGVPARASTAASGGSMVW